MGRDRAGRGLPKGRSGNNNPPPQKHSLKVHERSGENRGNTSSSKFHTAKRKGMAAGKGALATMPKNSGKNIRKIYVINTDIFVHDSTVLTNLKDNNIVVPFSVLDELDKFKTDRDELGDNGRKVANHIREISKNSNPEDGAKLATGGRLFIDNEGGIRLLEPIKNHKDKPDNRILAVALKWQLAHKDTPVIIITNDVNLMNKAAAYGIKAEEYKNDKVKIYEGFREIIDKSNLVDNIKRNGKVARPTADSEDIMPNEFVTIINKGERTETIHKDGLLTRLSIPETDTLFRISAKNSEQRFALELLFDPKIELITMTGKAGTGKTLLALYAAFEQLNKKRYSRISVARPIEPMGKDIGFLPGSIDEKMNPWMQPIYDNLEFLFSKRIQPDIDTDKKTSQNAHEEKLLQQRMHRKERKKERKNGKETKGKFPPTKDAGNGKLKLPWQDYVDKGLLYVEPLTYLRGRTLPRQIMIIDEVQNLSSGMIKSILTRAGEGTKVILTGDIDQIDSPYLNKYNNGLSVVVHYFKRYAQTGHIALKNSVRSPLAELVADLL